MNGAIAGRRILVIDDDPDWRGIINRALKSQNGICECAGDHREAIKLLLDGNNRYDLVISNVLLHPSEVEGWLEDAAGVFGNIVRRGFRRILFTQKKLVTDPGGNLIPYVQEYVSSDQIFYKGDKKSDSSADIIAAVEGALGFQPFLFQGLTPTLELLGEWADCIVCAIGGHLFCKESGILVSADIEHALETLERSIAEQLQRSPAKEPVRMTWQAFQLPNRDTKADQLKREIQQWQAPSAIDIWTYTEQLLRVIMEAKLYDLARLLREYYNLGFVMSLAMLLQEDDRTLDPRLQKEILCEELRLLARSNVHRRRRIAVETLRENPVAMLRAR